MEKNSSFFLMRFFVLRTSITYLCFERGGSESVFEDAIKIKFSAMKMKNDTIINI